MIDRAHYFRDGARVGFGLHHIASTLAHAALWSFVGRIVWHASPLVVVAIVAAAALWLLRGRGRGARGRRH